MSKQLLKATHEGKITLGDTELTCAVLSNGTRVITKSTVFKAFGRTKRGRNIGEIRVPNMPAFIDANNIQPFVSQELKDVLNPIDYIDKNEKVSTGYDATILPQMCKMYLDARQAKALKTQQLPLARASEILLLGLSNIGIIALVDEATGYQHEREKDELQKILKAYISEELLKWQKTFPDTYYSEIFRLNGWNFTVTDIKKRPGVVGTWTNKLIYEQLPKGILDELKTKTPKSATGNYTARFFQSLTADTGHPHLSAQLNQIIAIMRISDDWKEFISNFNKMVARKNGQLELKFSDLEPIEEEKIIKKKPLGDFDKVVKKFLDTPPPQKEEK